MIEVALPGATIGLILSGNWPNDCPSGWAAVERARVVRRGRGRTYVVTMMPADARDLRDYLASVADVVGSMSASERDGGREAAHARRGIQRLDEALAS